MNNSIETTSDKKTTDGSALIDRIVINFDFKKAKEKKKEDDALYRILESAKKLTW